MMTITADTITRRQIRDLGIKAFERGDMATFDLTVMAMRWDGEDPDVRAARKACAEAISIRYLEGPRSARFDVYNEGGIVVATRAGLGMPTRYVALPEADAVVDLSRFLRHDDDATSAG